MLKKNLTKWWSWSVEGLLSTGPTPSSFSCEDCETNFEVQKRVVINISQEKSSLQELD